MPYGPGGVGDLTMRLVADKLSQYLKQQFIIENRPGAGGIANATPVLRAEPDGYTLIEIGNGSTISTSLFNNLPYNVLTDFASISVTGSFEMLLGVPDNSPYKSLQELVDNAKKNPGKINLGAISPGSTQNLSAYLFEQVTGAKYTVIAYRTTPDLVTALLRGDVDVGFDYLRRTAKRNRSGQNSNHRDLRGTTRSAAQRCADRQGKRISGLHRQQLERPCRARESFAADHQRAA